VAPALIGGGAAAYAAVAIALAAFAPTAGAAASLHASEPAGAALGAELARFHAARGGQPAWLPDCLATPAALALAGLVAEAEAKGLDPTDYGGREWASRLAGARRGPAAACDQLDAAFSLAVLRYVSDLRDGRIDPRALAADLPPREREPLAAVLARLAASADPRAAVAELEPPFATYRRTLAALETYRRLAREAPALDLPQPRRRVVRGDAYAHAARLARHLEALGDVPPGAGAGAAGIYDAALSAAVARFQRRHGLAAHGALDAATAARLSVPLARRVDQLALTLERWRWLPRRLRAPPVVVNVPEFRLYADGGRLTMKVAAGSAFRWQTPVFAGELRHVVFRPAWHVPLSIQREELAPRWARGAARLAREGYEVVDPSGRVAAPGDPAEIAARLRSGELRLRQRPGPANALGLVKFDAPNRHGVFLHGTPAREVFARSRRDVTHGCIRLEDPAALAAWVLRDHPEWTRERIAAAMAAPRTAAVQLPSPVPLLVLYGTAVVAPDGEVRFLDDVYGLDATLERALAHQRRTRPVSTWTNPDSG
jgi:murein L,D-transpeptidase YcbB/YkuD